MSSVEIAARYPQLREDQSNIKTLGHNKENSPGAKREWIGHVVVKKGKISGNSP